jgi:glutamate-1-semialdehyde 2,1-aminomutase
MNGMAGPTTREWFERASRSLVFGVSSQYRYSGEDDTLVIERGEGAHVWDMDGNRYIDYRLGFGPVILGHGDERVREAVAEAAAGGNVFALTNRLEVEAAEAFLDAVAWADRMRFTNTGTEATMHALRIARGFTARETVVKIEGAYHGMHDHLLWSTAGAAVSALGSRNDPIAVRSSSGIPRALGELVRTVPYNDLGGIERLLSTAPVAAVIVEPLLGNAFGIAPEPGYLQGLRRLCDEHGTVLIFDEVKTGFRVARGGAHEVWGVAPDIGTYAKSLGNGFPVAALAFRQAIADVLIPGEIAQAGTYGGNVVAVAAARATLDALAAADAYAAVERAGSRLMDGIGRLCADRGVAVHVLGVPAMFGLAFCDERPRDYRGTAAHDEGLYEEVVRGLMRRGVFPDVDAREPWFLCAAHSDEDVDTTLSAFDDALTDVVR